MTRVCIVNFNVYCLFNPKSAAPMGGAELDMYTLAYGLKDSCVVSVVTGDWGQRRSEIHDGIRVLASVNFDSSYIANLVRFWQVLDSTQSDVYISSGAGIEVGIIGLFCRLKHKKYIYRTAHDMDCNGDYIRAHPLLGRGYEWGLTHAAAIVTSVTRHQPLLKARYANRLAPMSQINLGIIIGKRTRPKKESLLWVARCESWKNPDLFLDIVSRFPQEKCVMICPPQPHNLKLYTQIKTRAEMLPNLQFIPFVPFGAIQPYFDRAKLFINTSDAEGFTYTLIQSGLAATPVIYYRVNPNEVITTYNLGAWADGHKQRLLQSIDELLHRPAAWRTRSAAIKKYVEHYHTMHQLAPAWLGVIHALTK